MSMNGDNNLTTHFEVADAHNDSGSPVVGSVSVWQRMKWEFQQKGLCHAEELRAGTEERSSWLNVTKAIAPSSARYYRWVCWIWAMQVLLVDLQAYPPHNYYIYMGYLTHWGHVLVCTYFLVGFLACLERKSTTIVAATDDYTRTDQVVISRLLKATWLLYATVAPLQLGISALYWTLVYDSSDPITYVYVMEHGGFALLVWLDGLVLHRIPLRLKQMILVVSLAVLYLVWTIIDAVLGIGNGDWGPDDNDDTLYTVLNWNEDSSAAAILSLGVSLVVMPIIFLFLWWLSLISCGRNTHGCCSASALHRPLLDESAFVFNTTGTSSSFTNNNNAEETDDNHAVVQQPFVNADADSTSFSALWERWVWEWRNRPDLNDVDANGMFIDLVKCIAPHGWYSILFRVCCLCLSLYVLFIDVSNYPPHNLYIYMGYLTHWGHLVMNCYFLVSLISSLQSSYNITLLRGTSILFSVVLPLEIAIFLLYWSGTLGTILIDGRESAGPIGFVSYMEHGILALLVFIDGTILSRIPVRVAYILPLWTICLSYLLWSILDMVYNIGNGDWGPAYGDDDALYAVLNWKTQTWLATVVSAISLLVVVPTLFVLVWKQSLPGRAYHMSSSGSNIHDKYVRHTEVV